MSATAETLLSQPCPAWCIGAEAHDCGSHHSDVHGVDDLVIALTLNGRTPVVWVNDAYDQEFGLSVDDAEQLGMILLALAAQGRRAGTPATAGRQAA